MHPRGSLHETTPRTVRHDPAASNPNTAATATKAEMLNGVLTDRMHMAEATKTETGGGTGMCRRITGVTAAGSGAGTKVGAQIGAGGLIARMTGMHGSVMGTTGGAMGGSLRGPSCLLYTSPSPRD